MMIATVIMIRRLPGLPNDYLRKPVVLVAIAHVRIANNVRAVDITMAMVAVAPHKLLRLMFVFERYVKI